MNTIVGRALGVREKDYVLLVTVAVIEREGFSTDRFWSQEQIVVPLDRVAALDVNAMVDRGITNLQHIAAQNQPQKEEEK